MTPLTRTQLQELLIIGEGVPYSEAHRFALAHDAEQRAEIAELRERAQAAEWYESLVKRACIGTAKTPSLKTYIEQCEQEISRLREHDTEQRARIEFLERLSLPV